MADLRLRALICCGPGPIRDAAIALVGSADAFEIVGQASHADEVTEFARSTHPDVLVIDDALVGGDAKQLATRLALERPLPTLLLVDDDAGGAPTSLERRLRLFRLSKRQLRSTNTVDQSFARTRLRLVASRGHDSRTTVPPGELQSVLSALRSDDRRADTSARKLVATPLDLAVIALDSSHMEAMQEVLAEVSTLIVPALVVSEHSSVCETLAAVAAHKHLPAAWLTEPTSIRRASGLLFVEPRRRVVVRPSGVWVSALEQGPLSLPEVITSASTLEGSLLLAAASHRDVIMRTVADAAQAGANACLLEPPVTAPTTDNLVETSRDALAWMLGAGMIPRRV